MAAISKDAIGQAAISKFGLIRKGKRATSSPRHWPATEGAEPFVFRVLTCTELQESHAGAYVRLTDLKLNPNETVNLALFHDELATQILVRACRDAASPDRAFFDGPEVLRDHTTSDERALVVDWFSAFQADIDPSPKDLSPDVAAAIVELIKKKDAAGLSAYGSERLALYLLSTASPPSTSPTGSS